MLSPGDAWLVRQEPDLPGLGLLLDPERLQTELATRVPHQAVGKVHAVYTRYKPHTSCLVAYRIRTQGQENWAYATAYRRHAAEQLYTARPFDDPRAHIWHDMAVVWRFFPADRKLRGLAHLSTHHLDAELAAALGLGETPLPLVPLRYKPERRFVGRVNDGDRCWSLRCYSRDEYKTAKAAYHGLTHIDLPLARRVGRAKFAYALALEWRTGQPLDMMATSSPGWEAAGRVLRRLHGQSASKLHQVAPAPSSGVDAVAVLRPDQRERAAAIAARALFTLAASPAQTALIHGDFSADQCLVEPDGSVALLDLDNAAWGDPMSDLGSFAAYLDQAVALGIRDAAAAAQALEQCVAGYAEEDRRHPLTLYHSAHFEAQRVLSLLRRAPEPFRYRHVDWPKVCDAILSLAERRAYVAA